MNQTPSPPPCTAAHTAVLLCQNPTSSNPNQSQFQLYKQLKAQEREQDRDKATNTIHAHRRGQNRELAGNPEKFPFFESLSPQLPMAGQCELRRPLSGPWRIKAAKADQCGARWPLGGPKWVKMAS
ncbi:hypothetical protein ACLB2K_064366 [Fragaria x ananassa]